MLKGIAVLPHSAGMFTANEVRVQGETKEELLAHAWQECVGSRYVSSIYDATGTIELYSEAKGWLMEPTPEPE